MNKQNEKGRLTTFTKVLISSLLIVGCLAIGFYWGYYLAAEDMSETVSEEVQTQLQEQREALLNSEVTEAIDQVEESTEKLVEGERQKIRKVDMEKLFNDEIAGEDINFDEVGEIEYVDLTGDEIEEAVFSVKTTGSGGNMGVFVYGYQGGTLTRLLSDYEEGDFNYDFKIAGDILYVEAVDQDSAVNEERHKLEMCPDYKSFYKWSGEEFKQIQ